MKNLDLALVFVSDVDACLLDGQTYSAGGAAKALRALQDHGVPLVLCSSKTSSELRALQGRLRLEHPFICENGGALHIPAGYFPFEIPGSCRKNDDDVVAFAGAYEDVVSALRRAARAAGVDVMFFHDMSTADVAADSGLTRAEAERAKAREHDEPFRITCDESRGRERLAQVLAASGVGVMRGGRYDHAIAGADKGRATQALRRLYRKAYGPLTTVGLGDGLNDVPFLRSVDVPIVVRSVSEDVTREVHRHVPWARVTEKVGSSGWQDAVLAILGERVRLWTAGDRASREDGGAPL